jgi:hypothetical protein
LVPRAALRAGRPAVAVALLEGEVLPARPLDADVWVLRGKALLASGHARAACAAFARASELAPLRRDAAVALRVARAAHFRQYWELAVAALPFGADAVAVRDLAERGRGRAVVAAAQFDAGDTLFVETPLVLQTLVAGGEAARSDRPRGCAVCLRRGLADADLARLGVASLRGELYREHSPAGDVPCAAGCDVERYCSEACRTAAWNSYHRLLCPGPPTRSGSGALDEAPPGRRLVELARRLGRTNVLLVAKMLCMGAVAYLANGGDAIAAFECFDAFAAHLEPFDGDEEALRLVRAAIAQKHPLDGPGMMRLDGALDLERFRRYNSAIMRNAQTVQPVSDLHDFLVDLGEEDVAPVVHGFIAVAIGATRSLTLLDVLDSDAMAALNVVGASGLYSVANSMNHSCAPNAVVVSSFPDCRIRVVAVRDIAAEEEVCFSYVDENLPLEERRAKLLNYYQFLCECPRCLAELSSPSPTPTTASV